jgi:hypothetical protein
MLGDDDADLAVARVRAELDDGREDHQQSSGESARGAGPGPIRPQFLCQPTQQRCVK